MVKLKDIIDLKFLQEFQDTFANAIGISCIIIDDKGEPLTKPSRFTDFCTIFNRGCPKGNERCTRSDLNGAKKSSISGKPVIYECENGLIDFATPIMLGDTQIGAILGGQVLSKHYDEKQYIRIAKIIGVDPVLYVEALSRVPIMSYEKIDNAAQLLYIVSMQISKMGYQNKMIIDLANVLHENILVLIAATEELAASATEVHSTQIALTQEITNVSIISEQINTVLQDIGSLVDDINLLGLNATIEAARLGSIGSGFDVVAKEIRKLSTVSKRTLNQITRFTETINTTVNRTVNIGNITLENTSEQTEAIRGMITSIEELSLLSEKLQIIPV